MKNFTLARSLSASFAAALCAMTSLSMASCDRMEAPMQESPETPIPEISDISPEGIARMLCGVDLTSDQLSEVHSAVLSSAANGYDEEYTFKDMVNSPGAGVGDAILGVRSSIERGIPLRDLLQEQGGATPSTRSSSFLDELSRSGLQLYWPYSEDWDGKTLPTITFCPDDATASSNEGYIREKGNNGRWHLRKVIVDEEYSRTHPVWIVNWNEDSAYMTPQMLEKMGCVPEEPVQTKAGTTFRTLRIKEFKAHRNYDSIFAGGSEFIIKIGAINSFKADVAADIRLFAPTITDMVINVKRKQVGTFIRLNAVLVSEWSSQLDESAFLMLEDDGGKRTTWKCGGSVKIQSKSYGFEVEFPLNQNDDIVWRGPMSKNYFERYNGSPNRLGDVSVTFTLL